MSSDSPLRSGPIRVAVVDDHSLVADGLARIIEAESDLELAGTAGTVEEALTLVGHRRPDVVLMDYGLPDGDGAFATEQVLKRWPSTKVVMLSGAGGSELLARAIEAGCAGLIEKSRAGEEMVAAIRSVARGEAILRASDLTRLLGSLRNGGAQAQTLTGRETEVLQLIGRARSTEAIANELCISVNTVRNHVGRILMKLGAHSKLEAVAIATRDGIIRREVG